MKNKHLNNVPKLKKNNKFRQFIKKIDYIIGSIRRNFVKLNKDKYTRIQLCESILKLLTLLIISVVINIIMIITLIIILI